MAEAYYSLEFEIETSDSLIRGMKTRIVPSLAAAATLAVSESQSQAAVIAGGAGDTMATATTITMAEFSAGVTCSGDTTGASNAFSSPGGVSSLPFSYDGPDHWFTFTFPAAVNLSATLDLSGSSGDLAFFLLSSGGTNADVIGNSQDAIGAGAGPEVFSNPTPNPLSLAAGTYFFVIDSYYAAGAESAGTYELTFAPIANVPEPTTGTFLSLALGSLCFWRRRKRTA